MLSIISYLGNCEIYIRSHGPTMTLQIYIYSESIKAYFLDTVVGVVLKHFSTDAFPYISPPVNLLSTVTIKLSQWSLKYARKCQNLK